MDADADSATFASDLQDVNKKFNKKVFAYFFGYHKFTLVQIKRHKKLHYSRNQCSGSGSESRSTCYRPPGSGSFYQQAKIERKALIPTVNRLFTLSFLSHSDVKRAAFH
jgi:hypothetical protein